MTAVDDARRRFVALVDALPPVERTIIDGIFWERAPMREIARRLGWTLPGGGYDGKRVERGLPDIVERLSRACEVFELDFAALFGIEDVV